MATVRVQRGSLIFWCIMSDKSNILYLGYWSVNDALTTATILPHLRVLASFEKIQKIIYCSIERDSLGEMSVPDITKVEHVALSSKGFPLNMINKILDFIIFPDQLAEIAQLNNINALICRGAPAGSLGYLVYRKTGIPFSVESFEPHADYMNYSGVWKKFDLRFIFEKHWEKKQKKYSKFIMPVSNNYKLKLIKENVSEKKIKVLPCCVDIRKFRFSLKDRVKIRESLSVTNETIVGIYVGKFGGIYYEQEALKCFESAFKFFGMRFHLLVLTPIHDEEIRAMTRMYDIDIDYGRVNILKVSHQDVPKYLSASDFAFSFHRSSPISTAFSPIKNGEYWANGLPIVIPDNIGDDSDIVKTEGYGGVILSLDNMKDTFQQLEKVLGVKRESTLAQKYRSLDIVEEIYSECYAN